MFFFKDLFFNLWCVKWYFFAFDLPFMFQCLVFDKNLIKVQVYVTYFRCWNFGLHTFLGAFFFIWELYFYLFRCFFLFQSRFIVGQLVPPCGWFFRWGIQETNFVWSTYFFSFCWCQISKIQGILLIFVFFSVHHQNI